MASKKIAWIVTGYPCPDQKADVVEMYEAMNYVCSFCGDGANDVCALKMASVGISLSDLEASIAAPFTSTIPDISCVAELIKEGRTALVTTIGLFKLELKILNCRVPVLPRLPQKLNIAVN